MIITQHVLSFMGASEIHVIHWLQMCSTGRIWAASSWKATAPDGPRSTPRVWPWTMPRLEIRTSSQPTPTWTSKKLPEFAGGWTSRCFFRRVANIWPWPEIWPSMRPSNPVATNFGSRLKKLIQLGSGFSEICQKMTPSLLNRGAKRRPTKKATASILTQIWTVFSKPNVEIIFAHFAKSLKTVWSSLSGVYVKNIFCQNFDCQKFLHEFWRSK